MATYLSSSALFGSFWFVLSLESLFFFVMFLSLIAALRDPVAEATEVRLEVSARGVFTPRLPGGCFCNFSFCSLTRFHDY